METEKSQDGKQAEATRNFADKWLNNIFEVLMRIEDYERLAKNGCITLLEYIQNQNVIVDLALLQEKNFQLFMIEVEIILNDIKYFINKKEFLRLVLKFNQIKNYEKDIGGFIQVFYNMGDNTSKNVLKEEYNIIHPLMSELRSLLVKSLLEFINPKINTKYNREL